MGSADVSQEDKYKFSCGISQWNQVRNSANAVPIRHQLVLQSAPDCFAALQKEASERAAALSYLIHIRNYTIPEHTYGEGYIIPAQSQYWRAGRRSIIKTFCLSI